MKLLSRSLANRLAERGIVMTLTDSAVDAIADAGFDPIYGARPLKRYMQGKLETMLARKLVAGEILPGDTIAVEAEAGELVVRK